MEGAKSGNPDPNRQSKASHSSTNGPNDERTNMGGPRISNVDSGVSTSEQQKVSEGEGNARDIASPASSGQASSYPATVTGTDSLPQAQPSKGSMGFHFGTKVSQAVPAAPSPRQQGRSGGGVASDRGPLILRGFAAAAAPASRKVRETSAASEKITSSETRSATGTLDVSEHPPSDPGIRGPSVSFNTGQPDKGRSRPARKTATPARKSRSTVKREAPGFHAGMSDQSKAAPQRSSTTTTKECATTASKSDLSTGLTFVSPACVAPQGVQSSTAFAFGPTDQRNKSDLSAGFTFVSPACVASQGVQFSTAFVFGRTDQRKQGVDASAQAFTQQQRGSQRQGSKGSDAGGSCDSGLASPVPPTPRGTGFSFGQQASAPPTGDESELLREDKERREKAAEVLARLWKNHDADADRARRSLESRNFEDAALQYPEAIASLREVMNHISLQGDGDASSDIEDVKRNRLAPLCWNQAAANAMLGRHSNVVSDCAMALLSNIDFDQVYPPMGKTYFMAGELERADDAFCGGIRKDIKCEEDEQHNKECRLGMSNVRAVREHLENAKRAVERDARKSASTKQYII